MVEGKGLGIGIGIGIVIGIGIGVIGLPLVDNSMSEQPNPNPIAVVLPDIDDAHLAHIKANYFEDNNRLIVALILTNKDAGYTKADGHLEIRVYNDDRERVYSNEYDVTKDDFFSWKTNFGEKVTGYRIDETKYFASGSHDVYVDFTKKGGSTWQELHTDFYSIN